MTWIFASILSSSVLDNQWADGGGRIGGQNTYSATSWSVVNGLKWDNFPLNEVSYSDHCRFGLTLGNYEQDGYGLIWFSNYVELYWAHPFTEKAIHNS